MSPANVSHVKLTAVRSFYKYVNKISKFKFKMPLEIKQNAHLVPFPWWHRYRALSPPRARA